MKQTHLCRVVWRAALRTASQTTFRITPAVLCAALCLFLSSASHATENSPSTLAPTSDPALERLITLEAQRLPLPELLQELQKQSGAQIELAADSPWVRKAVTIRCHDMKLGEVLRALRRLYGIQWRQEAPGQWREQVAKPDVKPNPVVTVAAVTALPVNPALQSDLEYQLLRLGDIDVYEQQTARDRWVKTKWFDATEAASAVLKSADGVALVQFAPKLQNAARYECQNIAGVRLLASHARAVTASLENEWLNFGTTRPTRALAGANSASPQSASPQASFQNALSQSNAPLVSLQSLDGRLLTPLGLAQAPKPSLLNDTLQAPLPALSASPDFQR